MPEIVVYCGIPNSGKSSVAKTMQEISPYVIISRDAIREVHFPKPFIINKENENEVTKIFDFQYNKSTKRYRDIILDNTHCKEAYLNAEIKRKPEGYTLRIIFFDCPLWKAYIRNVLRWIMKGKFIPFEVIKQMKKNYDKIDKKKYSKIF